MLVRTVWDDEQEKWYFSVVGVVGILTNSWINQRLKNIEIRKDLTNEWKKDGLEEGVHFATLT